MALIKNLIKKYEEEARQRVAEAQKLNQPKQKRDDLFLKVETAPIKELHEYDTSGPRGSIWDVKPLGIESKAQELQVSPQQAYKSRTELEGEIEQLRAENEELKKRLSELQVERV